MSTVEVRDLRKTYGSVRAVDGVSFTVDEGEVVAVLGPNGAGKTTTVEILEGYRHRDGGEVRVLGFDPATGGAEYRQRIGIVLQECGITPYLTVAEVLAMHAGYYRHPRKVDEVVGLVGLDEKAGARIKTLSGGQRRRLDLALGLIGDPALLFLDEPTTGFDPSARRHAWEVVRNLCRLGKTVLLTTHYMDEAQTLADRVLLFAGGRIVGQGTPESIGGRQDGVARIRFRLPSGVGAAELPLAATAVDGDDVLIETPTPTADLHKLTGWARRRHAELAGLTVTRPSLEDVYLALTAEAAQ